jgi:hypothetical protein
METAELHKALDEPVVLLHWPAGGEAGLPAQEQHEYGNMHQIMLICLPNRFFNKLFESTDRGRSDDSTKIFCCKGLTVRFSRIQSFFYYHLLATIFSNYVFAIVPQLFDAYVIRSTRAYIHSNFYKWMQDTDSAVNAGHWPGRKSGTLTRQRMRDTDPAGNAGHWPGRECGTLTRQWMRDTDPAVNAGHWPGSECGTLNRQRRRDTDPAVTAGHWPGREWGTLARQRMRDTDPAVNAGHWPGSECGTLTQQSMRDTDPAANAGHWPGNECGTQIRQRMRDTDAARARLYWYL